MSQVGTSGPFSGCALREVVVVHDVHALNGPLQGRWQLPLHVDSSARPFYDFGLARDRAQAYQLVLLEAAEAADLERWLQHDEQGCTSAVTVRAPNLTWAGLARS